MEPDRISCLPRVVLDQILSRLPLREAVRSSVLSSEWRYKWTTLPDIVIDSLCVSEDDSVVGDKLARIIDHVLSLHSGQINKFEISYEDLTKDLSGPIGSDRWALNLSRSSVNEFVWNIIDRAGQWYRVPSCLFACQSLVRLQLYGCLIEPPSTFLGFRVLKNLTLEDVVFAQDAFENLISSCPLLERLQLWEFDGPSHLNIEALNLRYLDILGGFEDVSFKNTFHLAEISIYLSLNFEGSGESSSNLLKFFYHLHHVRRLKFAGIFLKYLAMGIVPLKLPNPCIDLNYLTMCVNFKDSKEVSAVVCLLRSSPNLQELRILSGVEIWPVPGTHFYSWEDHRSCPFMQLRFVWIEYITGTKPELDFIRFLLTDSPVLERMTVKPGLESGGEFLPIELLRLRRASASAEIVYIYS